MGHLSPMPPTTTTLFIYCTRPSPNSHLFKGFWIKLKGFCLLQHFFLSMEDTASNNTKKKTKKTQTSKAKFHSDLTLCSKNKDFHAAISIRYRNFTTTTTHSPQSIPFQFPCLPMLQFRHRPVTQASDFELWLLHIQSYVVTQYQAQWGLDYCYCPPGCCQRWWQLRPLSSSRSNLELWYQFVVIWGLMCALYCKFYTVNWNFFRLILYVI